MKRRLDIRAIVMSLFALLAIVMIMLQLQKSMPKAPPVLEKMTAGQRIAVVDSSYINLPLKFIWTMPNAFWRLSIISSDTLPPLLDDSALFSEILWLVQAERRQNGESLLRARIGVFAHETDKTASDIAVSLLAERLADLEKGGARATILQPVSAPAHPLLKGAWFVLQGPDDAVNTVQLVVVLPRRENRFILSCDSNTNSYNHYRDEIEVLVQRFYPIPRKVLP